LHYSLRNFDIYVLFFKEGDIDQYLVVAKVMERLAVFKQAAQKFDVERFNLRKLSELEVRKEFQIKILNRFAALENLNDGEDIELRKTLKRINIKTSDKESLLGLYELKQHKPCFDEQCSRYFEQRKKAKMQ